MVFQRPPGRLYDVEAMGGDLVSLWRSRKTWNKAFCTPGSRQERRLSPGGGRERGLLSAVAFDLGGYPYPEYMSIDSTVWLDTAGDALSTPGQDEFARWVLGRVEPLKLEVAVEHENDGFSGLTSSDARVLAPQRGKQGRGIDYSIQKLALIRAPLRVLICYPSAREPLSQEGVEAVATAASNRIERLIEAQAASHAADEWLCIMGFLASDDSQAPHVLWRHRVLGGSGAAIP